MKKKIIDLITYFAPEVWWRDKLADQILAAFKAHIEECERPKTPWELGPHRSDAFEYGVDKDRKKMLESLE